MVFLAKALISQPAYLLIDELSLGLASVVVSRLIPVIAAVAESGSGVLLIEQFATVALDLANHAHVMEGGRIRFSGPASELRGHPDLLTSAYLLRRQHRRPRPLGCPSGTATPAASRNPLFLDAERTVVSPPGREKPRAGSCDPARGHRALRPD